MTPLLPRRRSPFRSLPLALALTLAAPICFVSGGASAQTAPPQAQAPAGAAGAGAKPAVGIGVGTFLASTNGTTPGGNAPGDIGWPGADLVRRGVVQIERGGRVIGLGSVLGHDGRILTSLSVLQNGATSDADVRYADGSLAHAKLGHKDAEWDLALLVPQNGPKWSDGLNASAGDPAGATLRAFGPRPAGSAAKGVAAGPRVTSAPFQGRTDVHAASGTDLDGAMSLQAQGAALGSPVVDADGSVLAVLVRACRNAPAASPPPAPPAGQAALAAPRPAPAGASAKAPACSAVMIGAPVRAVRDFLVRTPSTAAAPSPWLGIVGESATAGSTRGVRVMAVAPGSPADKAGLQASTDPAKADLVTAVDGVPVDSPDRLAEEIAKRPIGSKTPLLLLKDGRLKEATVTLRAAP